MDSHYKNKLNSFPLLDAIEETCKGCWAKILNEISYIKGIIYNMLLTGH